ncbi:MAG: sulfurtransferase TusA family protein [Anaerolineaceae bacterium]|nr:sulfurtransferase TusA family protein [Anaerolineaceae bacterium]
MSAVLDTRGLSCPQPVMMVQQAIEKGNLPLEVLADTVTARENIERFAERKGFKVQVTEQDDEFTMVIRK